MTAPSITSSVSSLASDSTISTASCVPATTRSSWLSAISSSTGLSTYSLLMKPTRAAPIGPMNGAPERVRAVDQPRDQRLFLGRAAFALEIAAGDAARGVEFLLVVDGERQEVDAFSPLLGGDHGRQHLRFAVGGDDGAVGLARDL